MICIHVCHYTHSGSFQQVLDIMGPPVCHSFVDVPHRGIQITLARVTWWWKFLVLNHIDQVEHIWSAYSVQSFTHHNCAIYGGVTWHLLLKTFRSTKAMIYISVVTSMVSTHSYWFIWSLSWSFLFLSYCVVACDRNTPFFYFFVSCLCSWDVWQKNKNIVMSSFIYSPVFWNIWRLLTNFFFFF